MTAPTNNSYGTIEALDARASHYIKEKNKMSDVSKAVENKKEIEIVGVSGAAIKFTVKKLPLGKVIDLLNAVERLPKEVANIDKMGEDEILENIATLIAASLPKFVGVIARAIDDQVVTEKVILEEFGIVEAVDTIYAILEVNNIFGIMQTLKKVQALTRPQLASK